MRVNLLLAAWIVFVAFIAIVSARISYDFQVKLSAGLVLASCAISLVTTAVWFAVLMLPGPKILWLSVLADVVYATFYNATLILAAGSRPTPAQGAGLLLAMGGLYLLR